MRSLKSRREFLRSQSFYVEGQSFPPPLTSPNQSEPNCRAAAPLTSASQDTSETKGADIPPVTPSKEPGQSLQASSVTRPSPWVVARWVCAFLAWIRAAEALRTLYMTMVQLVLCAIVSHYFSRFFPFASENTVLHATGLFSLSAPSDAVYFSQLQRVLQTFSNGDLMREDFALASAGGAIVPLLTSTHAESHFPRGLATNTPPPYPSSVVLNTVLKLGTCWHVYSRSAYIGISFQQPLIITHITIDHVVESPEDSPRNVVIWGLLEGDANLAKYQAFKGDLDGNDGLAPPPALLAAVQSNSRASLVKLVHFQFEHPFLSLASIQSFPINPAFEGIDFGVIVVDIRDNWGAPVTCIYRIRVHGHPVEFN